MKRVEKWLWRIRWGGRMTTTRVHFTEDEIRREHPEAVRIEESRVEVELPETEAEFDAARRPRAAVEVPERATSKVVVRR